MSALFAPDLSIGAASVVVPPEQADAKSDPRALFETADWALYGAKRAGRHRVWDARHKPLEGDPQLS